MRALRAGRGTAPNCNRRGVQGIVREVGCEGRRQEATRGARGARVKNGVAALFAPLVVAPELTWSSYTGSVRVFRCEGASVARVCVCVCVCALLLRSGYAHRRVGVAVCAQTFFNHIQSPSPKTPTFHPTASERNNCHPPPHPPLPLPLRAQMHPVTCSSPPSPSTATVPRSQQP